MATFSPTAARRPWTSRSLRTLLVVPVALALLVAGGIPQSARAAEATFSFSGHGWGHGRGMGQYGAYGYAVDHGWGYGQILSHFYGGTTLRADVGNPWLGVEITRLTGRDTVVKGPGLRVNDQPTGSGAALVRRDAATGAFQVFVGPGCGGPWTPWSSGVPTGVVVSTAAAPTSASDLLSLCEAGRTTAYRGVIQVVSSAGAQVTVNHLGVDDYLRSVVPSESPASWGNAGGGRGMEALKAQTVAARSYALSSAPRPSGATTCDTTSCQVYQGASVAVDGVAVRSVEQSTTNDAVVATTGQVMRTPTGGVARTEFSSSTGGYTAGGAFPAVPDAGDATAANPNRNWSVSFTQSAVGTALGTGPVASIAVVRRNGLGAEGGRVLSVAVQGTDGRQHSFTGNQVRVALGLKSDWFSIGGVSAQQATALVNALYADILGRAPDPGGLSTWTGAVMASGDPGPVAAGIVRSHERYWTFVQQQYQVALGRVPDPVGTQTWVSALQNGMTVPELQVQVYASEEGFSTLGRGSVETWVDEVYRRTLGRPAAPGEQTAWAAYARSSGRHAVVRGIVLSDEGALYRLNGYYLTMLGRPADPAGIASYKPMMWGPGDFVLPIEIGRSAEYFGRAQTR